MARLFTYYPAGDGTPRVLNDRDNGFRVLKGIKGLNAPDFQLLTSDTPLLDGEQLDDVYAEPRSIVLPMLIAGRTEAEFRERAKGLIEDLLPIRGEGVFEVAQADGQRRRVAAIYLGGAQGSESVNEGGIRWWKFELEMRALNPWWLGDPVTQKWEYAEPTAFLPITPRKVSSSTVLGAATLNNPGDVDTYPVWTLTAPATSVTLTRPDTGEFFGITQPVPTGRTLTIKTRPRETLVSLDDGTPFWHLANGSSLWRLPADRDGNGSPLSLVVGGAAAGTVLTVSYTPRYATSL